MDNSGFNSINSSSIMTNQTLSMDNIASGTSSISSETAMQTFLVYALDGTPISLSFQKLDDWYFYFVKMSTIFGAQLGATALLFGLLLMLGRPARLRSPVYLLNVISLIFNFFRCLFNILYFNGPFAEAFVFFTNAPYVPSSAYGISVAAEVFATLLLLTIETSLVMQANVVCSTLRKQTRTAITGTLSLVAALTVSLRLALMIYKIKILLDSTVNFDEDPLVSASDIMVAISICIFSGVFTFKLGAAVLSRRKLGLKQFGPMQVIFIMGCQTSIIPGKFR